MRNLTDYNDQFILDLIKQVNGNPYKCTANVQYAVRFNRLIPVLVIYQDYSIGWDCDDRVIFCKDTAIIDFCDEMCISISDADNMLDYYSTVEFQKTVNDIEYEEEYDEWLYQEFAWYSHARQMGWE